MGGRRASSKVMDRKFTPLSFPGRTAGPHRQRRQHEQGLGRLGSLLSTARRTRQERSGLREHRLFGRHLTRLPADRHRGSGWRSSSGRRSAASSCNRWRATRPRCGRWRFPDGYHLAAGHGDGSVRVWESFLGRRLHVFEGHVGGVNTVAFSPDGLHMITAGGEGRIKVRRSEDGTRVTFDPAETSRGLLGQFFPGRLPHCPAG